MICHRKTNTSMGYEYKIKAKFTEEQKCDILTLLKTHKDFDKEYTFAGKHFIDLRCADNRGKMPNLFISFEENGLYLCQNGSSYLWTDLESLKSYLEALKIEYEIHDYSE